MPLRLGVSPLGWGSHTWWGLRDATGACWGNSVVGIGPVVSWGAYPSARTSEPTGVEIPLTSHTFQSYLDFLPLIPRPKNQGLR